MSDSEQKKTTDQMLNEKIFPAIILILSIVAVILLFITDFGGWYIYRPSDYDIWRYVHMFSQMLWWSFIWLLPLAGSFVFVGFIAAMTLFSPDSAWAKKFNLMFLISVGSAGVTFLAALIFILTVLDTSDWWLDAAFWGGLIGGSLNAVFSYLILRGKGEKIKFSLKA